MITAVLIAAARPRGDRGPAPHPAAGACCAPTRQSHVDTVTISEPRLSTTGPTIVHFSASWCGPCAAVRRVVDQVCADLPDVAHVEIDMDANPVAANFRCCRCRRRSSSIPPAPRYRTSGVPSGRRSALGRATTAWPDRGPIGWLCLVSARLSFCSPSAAQWICAASRVVAVVVVAAESFAPSPPLTGQPTLACSCRPRQQRKTPMSHRSNACPNADQVDVPRTTVRRLGHHRGADRHPAVAGGHDGRSGRAGVAGVVFAIGAARAPRASLRPDLRDVRHPAVSPVTVQEREPVPPLRLPNWSAWSSRSSGTAGFAFGAPAARSGRHRVRTVRRVPQRGVRHLPGLPDLPADTAPAAAPGAGDQLTTVRTRKGK